MLDEQVLDAEKEANIAFAIEQDVQVSSRVQKLAIYLVYALSMYCGFLSGKVIMGFCERAASSNQTILTRIFFKENIRNTSTLIPSVPAIGADALNPEAFAIARGFSGPLTSQVILPPATTGALFEPSFILGGVYISSDGACALVNGKIVKAGDKIGGAAVKAITPDSVKLDLSGKQIELTL